MIQKKFSNIFKNNQINDIKNIEIKKNTGNNCIYELTTSTNKLILKEFLLSKNDNFSRIKNEVIFLSYANKYCGKFTPKILDFDYENNLVLYEYIDGKKLLPHDINEITINQAINFFKDLNLYRNNVKNISPAKDSCKSIGSHINLINNRVESINKYCFNKVPNKLLLRLNVLWNKIVDKIKSDCIKLNIDISYTLSDSEICLSPSDFGFHNCLMANNNQLIFFDFEYAGWDDPAKLVGDFFSQISVPVCQSHFEFFANEINGIFNIQNGIERINILRYAYRLKWICIVLNIFDNEIMNRRLFSNPELKINDLRNEKILKANQMIKNLESEISYESN